MEWIYTRTRVSGQISLELASLMKKKKERKKEREMVIFQISGSADMYNCCNE
jgi:hypothetical protein